MKTGEGKTFVAALPSYLNGLTGKGVHIVTVNDYLAKRDSELMAKVHRYLGLTVGLIAHDMDNDARRAAYACDITYATNNELGFVFSSKSCSFNTEKKGGQRSDFSARSFLNKIYPWRLTFKC